MKESEHYTLSPGELHPPVIPFPSSPVCPKCGTVGGFVFRPGIFSHCHKCGYVGELVREVMPLTKRMKAQPYAGGREKVGTKGRTAHKLRPCQEKEER